jgi:hypothetical protein
VLDKELDKVFHQRQSTRSPRPAHFSVPRTLFLAEVRLGESRDFPPWLFINTRTKMCGGNSSGFLALQLTDFPVPRSFLRLEGRDVWRDELISEDEDLNHPAIFIEGDLSEGEKGGNEAICFCTGHEDSLNIH